MFDLKNTRVISFLLLLVFYIPNLGIAGIEENRFAEKLKLAQEGDIEAQSDVGDFYYNGRGVKEDKEKGVEWLEKAASQGNDLAKIRLDTHYLNVYIFSFLVRTKLTKPDQACKIDLPSEQINKFLDWLYKSAESGNIQAQEMSANIYRSGCGVSRDLQKAAFYYEKAAEQNSASAQASLALMYQEGTGVPKSTSNFFKWAKKSAENGDRNGQYLLGFAYLMGEGVKKSFKNCYIWMLVSSANGNKNADYDVGELEKILSAKEISEGKKAAEKIIATQKK